MCGIYGATKASKFEVLDTVNKVRGNFASGIYYYNGNEYDYQKTEGSFDWNKIELPKGFTFLGHNQAPTSNERQWKEHNCHPFVYDNWIVAHNGVLTNFSQLKNDYIPDHANLVDSSIIPALLVHFEKTFDEANTKEKELNLVSYVLELLEGTFGLWIVNLKTMNIYLARQGSTLFFDKNSFSSAKGKGYKELKEGVIYKFNRRGVIPVEKFKVKSPFLEL
jgi:glucosamine 6-phosphate synthetase-like amidotransferase/phosphosugar isomerase protein